MKQSLSIIAKMLFLSLLTFTAIRLGYRLQYPDYFHELTLLQTTKSALFGLRYDASLSVLITALFCLLLLMPFPLLKHPRSKKILAWLSFITLAVAWIVNLGTLAYFGEVYRHAGKEVIAATNEAGGFVDFALGPFWYITAFGSLGLIILAAVWHFWIIKPISLPIKQAKWYQELSLSLLGVLLLVFAARGMVVSGKALSTIDAFHLGNEKEAVLSINGAFHLFQAVRKADNQPAFQRFSNEELTALLKQQNLPQSNDPFIRVLPSTEKKAKNVVLIAVESLNFDAIDGISGNHRGATPYIDSILPHSRYYTNFYSSGQRSIEGIQSILTSIPLLDDQPFLGFGLELNAISRIAENLNQQGYQTTMSQASARRSFYMDGIANALGFENYYGREDYPELLKYPNPPAWGWDYEALMHLFNKVQQEQVKQTSPLFTFTFTAATHSPFNDPGAQFHIKPHVINEMDGFYNTVRYFDWSLEQFMEAAKKESWYQDTVFIITADHVLRASTDGSAWKDSFHIPLIIYAPDGSIEAGEDNRFASHYDIMPTVADLAGKPMNVAAFGYSLLSENKPFNGALVKRSETFAWLSDKGWFSFTTDKNQQSSEFYQQNPDVLKAEQDYIFTRLQAVDDRLNKNKWFTNQVYP